MFEERECGFKRFLPAKRFADLLGRKLLLVQSVATRDRRFKAEGLRVHRITASTPTPSPTAPVRSPTTAVSLSSEIAGQHCALARIGFSEILALPFVDQSTVGANYRQPRREIDVATVKGNLFAWGQGPIVN